MYEAEHPFGSLLREGHNETCAIRDLDGTMRFLWEELPEGRWFVGPLYVDHLEEEEMIDEEYGFAYWIDEGGYSFSVEELRAAIATLPGTRSQLLGSSFGGGPTLRQPRRQLPRLALDEPGRQCIADQFGCLVLPASERKDVVGTERLQ